MGKTLSAQAEQKLTDKLRQMPKRLLSGRRDFKFAQNEEGFWAKLTGYGSGCYYWSRLAVDHTDPSGFAFSTPEVTGNLAHDSALSGGERIGHYVFCHHGYPFKVEDDQLDFHIWFQGNAGVFEVTLERDDSGGDAAKGSATTVCSMTYKAKHIDTGDVLKATGGDPESGDATGLAPEEDRTEKGLRTAAVRGLARRKADGTLVLIEAYEPRAKVKRACTGGGG